MNPLNPQVTIKFKLLVLQSRLATTPVELLGRTEAFNNFLVHAHDTGDFNELFAELGRLH